MSTRRRLIPGLLLATSALLGGESTAAQAASCALTGAITAKSTGKGGGNLPGVSQYVCASMALLPPFNGPDAASGGSGQTFSFASTRPDAPAPASLNNSMVVVILAPPAPGTYDLSQIQGYIQYGYLNNSYCASPTGSITITSVGKGTGAGSFTASALCDRTGATKYRNVTGSFHIP